MTKPITIFRSGRHVDAIGLEAAFSVADLTAIAEGYDPAIHEAPLVVGHPQTDGPAFGWVGSLTTDGTHLLAHPQQVDPGFAEMVASGRFKKISASFYTPASPRNPKPGQYYLRHVGFLGAQPPAIKGLPDARFADDGEGVVYYLEPGATNVTEEEQQKQQELTALQADLSRKALDFAEREKKLQEAEHAFNRREITTRVQDLAKDGKILPKDEAGLISFLEGVPEDNVVSFSEDGKNVQVPSRAWLQDFLARLPTMVNYGEHPGTKTAAAAAGPGRLSVPLGRPLDQDRLALHRKALAYAESIGHNPNDPDQYIAAVIAVEGN